MINHFEFEDPSVKPQHRTLLMFKATVQTLASGFVPQRSLCHVIKRGESISSLQYFGHFPVLDPSTKIKSRFRSCIWQLYLYKRNWTGFKSPVLFSSVSKSFASPQAVPGCAYSVFSHAETRVLFWGWCYSQETHCPMGLFDAVYQ